MDGASQKLMDFCINTGASIHIFTNVETKYATLSLVSTQLHQELGRTRLIPKKGRPSMEFISSPLSSLSLIDFTFEGITSIPYIPSRWRERRSHTQRRGQHTAHQQCSPIIRTIGNQIEQDTPSSTLRSHQLDSIWLSLEHASDVRSYRSLGGLQRLQCLPSLPLSFEAGHCSSNSDDVPGNAA